MKRRLLSARATIGITAAVALLVGSAAPAFAVPVTPDRLAGGDRYATSAVIAEKLFDTASTVFVASGVDYPDALAGAPAAAGLRAPLLLTGTEVSAAVEAQITRLKPASIVVLGGTGSVSESVESHLAALADTVTRVAGAGRYETAVEISAASFPDGAETVFVASGENYADALAGAPAAGAQRSPVLLVPSTEVPEAVSTELTRLAPTRIVLLGGEGAVPAAVESALAEHAPVTRLAGANRYDTSAVIAGAYPGASKTVVAASGQTFPDALAVAVPAGIVGAPLLLVARDTVSASVAESLKSLDPARVIIAGGTGTINDEVAGFLGDPSRPRPVPAPAPAPVTPSDPASPAPGAGPDRVENGVTPGAFCSPAGAKGITVNNKPMVCKTTTDDARLRWREG